MRVLICDDEPDIQLLLELNVRSLGHDPEVVGSAHEAIDVCEAGAPDALLLDVSMPEIDGPTLLTMLRERGVQPEHTTLVSGIVPWELRDIAERLEVGYITKPFSIDHVRMALADAA